MISKVTWSTPAFLLRIVPARSNNRGMSRSLLSTHRGADIQQPHREQFARIVQWQQMVDRPRERGTAEQHLVHREGGRPRGSAQSGEPGEEEVALRKRGGGGRPPPP